MSKKSYLDQFIAFLLIIGFTSSVKITLFDSTNFKEDLNWPKISFKENEIDWLNDKAIAKNVKNGINGWKEGSFSTLTDDEVWRIHFVCDLNVQNIQNWLFIPLIDTQKANRITLNLTFTIRECQHFPTMFPKNCREKFQLYYEQISNLSLEKNQTFDFFLEKIRKMKFKDTFVSDTGLRFYTSEVNRQTISTINVESREISLAPFDQEPSYIRFAIRDTGACISLLSVKVSYTSCPAFNKYGISFPETSTGRDITDLVQVNGNCPLFTSSIHPPKAICTAKGEWLITDQSLSNRCLCLPGYELTNDYCSPCFPGFYKKSTSNEIKCTRCPANTWSNNSASSKCECITGYYRLEELSQTTSCKPIKVIEIQHLNLTLFAPNKINISVDRHSAGIDPLVNLEITCYFCIHKNCTIPCSVKSVFSEWMEITTFLGHQKRSLTIQLLINQKINGKNLTTSTILINLNEAANDFSSTFLKEVEEQKEELGFKCKIFQNLENSLKKICLNITLDLNSQLTASFPRAEITRHIRRAHPIKLKIFWKISHNESKTSSEQFSLLKLFETSYFKSLFHIPIVFCEKTESIVIQAHFLDTEESSLHIYTTRFSTTNLCKTVNSVRPKSTQTSMIVASNQLLKNETASFYPKFHIGLPVFMSFVLVLMLIVSVVSFRRSQFSANKILENNFKFGGRLSKTKNNPIVNKFINFVDIFDEGKFFPIQNSEPNCASSVVSSSATSTTCTTSQILEQSSKLYYVDPHSYEDPEAAVREFTNEISPLDIEIDAIIGGGEFGDVCKGKLKCSNNGWITVAIKTLKVDSTEKNRCDFLAEASIMAQFNHKNVISLEGVVTQSRPYMIITEFMENGSLDCFLRLNSWCLKVQDLIKMLMNIANGMKYLSDMNFVHRDLAARNILVDKNLECKVADFGLSREIVGDNYEGFYWTKGGKIPVRWTAPEAISFTKFTCSSDVWSFGVLVWEVMSYGERPYWNWSNSEVIKAVEKGFRLIIPQNCPPFLYNLMLECWNSDRTKRPKFKSIYEDLENLLNSEKLYEISCENKLSIYIDPNSPNFAQLTSIGEWLASLGLISHFIHFASRKILNLSQVLLFDKDDLTLIEINDEDVQNKILDSLKQVKTVLSYQDGFLV